MKKFLSILTIAAFLATAPMSFADFQDDSGVGNGNVTVTTLGGGIDAGIKTLPQHSGIAGGIGLAGGINVGGAFGLVDDGTVQLGAGAFSGGVAENNVARQSGYAGFDRSIGVSSSSAASAATIGDVAVSVDPMGHYVIDAYGIAAGGFIGIAGQGTADFSAVGPSPLKGWESEGYSAGIAGQGSAGYVYGTAHAESLGDLAYDRVAYENLNDSKPGDPGYYWKWKNPNKKWQGKEYKEFPNGRTDNELAEWTFLGDTKVVEHIAIIDNNASAEAGAGISMSGASLSESWRGVADTDDGRHIEAMGTFIYADTQIVATGYSGADSTIAANSGACVQGGYAVIGGAASKTVQYSQNGVSKATANGKYTGSAGLNTTFNGVADGSTQTSVTTVDGMNGAFHGARATMTVTSNIHND